MWKRREPAAASPAGRFGVGVQVIVRLDRSRFPDSLVDDPIGVITAAGEQLGTALYATTVPREPIWEVQFEEPFYGLDGSGPHESARVPQSLLEATPEA